MYVCIYIYDYICIHGQTCRYQLPTLLRLYLGLVLELQRHSQKVFGAQEIQYTCTCVYVYHMHVCLHLLYEHICILHVYALHIHIHIYTYRDVHMYTYIYTYIHIWYIIYTYTYRYRYRYIYIYTGIQIYTYTHTCHIIIYVYIIYTHTCHQPFDYTRNSPCEARSQNLSGAKNGYLLSLWRDCGNLKYLPKGSPRILSDFRESQIGSPI